MTPERRKATRWGLLATLALAGLIVLGSRTLTRFDIALLGYTFATLFAVFAITYRWVMWLQRPPTAMYWRRGGQLLLRRGGFGRHALRLLQRLVADFAANRFIWRRGLLRGAAHWCIMWGCLIAVGITLPLVCGWVHFGTVPGDLTRYRVHVFGFATDEFAIHSLYGFFIFHSLVWPSLLVIVGVLLAMRRRLRDGGAAALQQFGEDFLPLLLLFAISVTGLLLTVSYTWMRGYAHELLALLHAITVIFTLLWLPFGKLFHIFMRPVHLAVGAYKDAGREGEQAHCSRCHAAFASRMHVEDLIEVERQLGYRYEIETAATIKATTPTDSGSSTAIELFGNDNNIAITKNLPQTGNTYGIRIDNANTAPNSNIAITEQHYQWICPACRRALVCLAHTALWTDEGERGRVSVPSAEATRDAYVIPLANHSRTVVTL